eukprot:5427474-Ditylum_brightwellii.AAC.1
MEISAGFYYKDSDSTKDYVLRLKKKFHGLKQASFNWSELLKADLLRQGATVFFNPNDSIINKEISAPKSNGFELTDGGDVDYFLEVKFTFSENGMPPASTALPPEGEQTSQEETNDDVSEISGS